MPACRSSLPGSAETSWSSDSRALEPLSISASPCGPKVTFVSACVATAPTPTSVNGTTAPIASE